MGVKTWPNPTGSLVPKSGCARRSCQMRLFLKEFNSGLNIYCDVSRAVVLWLWQRAHSASRSLWSHGCQPAKLGLYADIPGSASLNTIYRQLPKLTWSDFRKFAIRTLDINKGYHEKVIPASTFTFCFTKPVDKEVQIIIFTESAPRSIQSSNRNVHNKDGSLKHWWPLGIFYEPTRGSPVSCNNGHGLKQLCIGSLSQIMSTTEGGGERVWKMLKLADKRGRRGLENTDIGW